MKRVFLALAAILGIGAVVGRPRFKAAARYWDRALWAAVHFRDAGYEMRMVVDTIVFGQKWAVQREKDRQFRREYTGSMKESQSVFSPSLGDYLDPKGGS